MPFHNTAHLKDSELHLLPANPVAGCHSHRSVVIITSGSVSIPLLHPQLRPALTNFPWTLQGFAAQQRQQHCRDCGTRNEMCPCRPAALAQLNHHSTHNSRAGDLPFTLCQHTLPALRLQDQYTRAQQRQEDLFALLASS